MVTGGEIMETEQTMFIRRLTILMDEKDLTPVDITKI